MLIAYATAGETTTAIGSSQPRNRLRSVVYDESTNYVAWSSSSGPRLARQWPTFQPTHYGERPKLRLHALLSTS